MTFEDKTNQLISQCEKLTDELFDLCPTHELLIFSMCSCSNEQEKDMVADVFQNTFCPKGADPKNPTAGAISLMWESYKCALEAVILILQAQQGFFNPRL